MPTENRVRRHNRGDLPEDPTSEPFAEDSQATALVIGQPQSPAAQLRLQDAVFFPEILDGFMLLLLHKANESNQDQ